MIEGAIGLGPRPSARLTILVVAGLILITAAVRIPLLRVPFERDEGEYAYIAWRLGHNELPYRDWVDQKPPAIFWIYRAALTFPVDPIRAVHFAALLFSAASACALFFLARRFMNRASRNAGLDFVGRRFDRADCCRQGQMVRFSRGLVDHEHDRRKRERLFLSTLLPATAAAACFDRGFRREMAKRAPAMEKFVGSRSAVQPFTCDSSAENALAVLVQVHTGRCGAKDLSRKFLCRNA